MAETIIIFLVFLTEMRKLENPTTPKPTAPPPTRRITASDMFLPYQPISPRPTHSSSATRQFCAQGMFFYNVKLRDGWNAGMRLQVVPVRSMAECIEFCCGEPACDFVMLKKRKCHTVRCRVGDACTVEEGGDYQISFVSRQGKKMQNKKIRCFAHCFVG